MVAIATSLGRNGVHDWIIQRVTAVILAVFSIYVMYFFASTPNLDQQQLVAFFTQPVVRWFAIASIISISLHAWIGLWIVSTDYIKPLAMRIVFQVFVIIACLTFIGWGASILWGMK